ncbi:MAG: hypothetical protein KAJ14_05350 [Candidatus Omnitrophica bacterium]|nr:hypothetical protein [Candidatus Omnitrophota bacterium]MCK5288896.1 hypothetical protein [Candidatus Omnitrophota bacterium]MCK5492519.1 hypothetical protein [Candidatus Omnitrophota bacterium]
MALLKIVKKGRPKKAIKYTKTINVRLTELQWEQVMNWAQKAKLEPSVYIRKVVLDFLNIEHDIGYNNLPK